MKLLVVSLLRLGDIIQQVPLLRGLREKNPNAEIHVLINRQFTSVEPLLHGVVDRFFYFDREGLQKGLGEASYNILWSYSQLESLVKDLNAQGYDQVLNFTHNKLSAYLIGAMNISDKRGLYQDDGRFRGLENRWLRYFNDRFSGAGKSLFHYVEILGKSFDIPVSPQILQPRGKSKLIIFQCLTSDKKKNWGLQNYVNLKATIEEALVDFKVCVLGAPFEREALASAFSEDSLLICDLQEAQGHLQRAALLVTGDTSVKHLAAQIGTPIVEIALGSSDWTKTAAFALGSQVLMSSVPCAPCGHSQVCSQKSHLCSEEITVDKVFTAVWDQLSNAKIAKAPQARDFDRTVWSLYLDKNNKDVEPFYANAALEFVNSFGEQVLQSQREQWAATTGQYKNWLERIERSLPSRESFIKRTSLSGGDIADLVLCAQEILKSKKDEAGYFQSFVEGLTQRFAQPVQVYDRVAAALSEIREFIEIRENLTRYMDVVSKGGAYYATGIGKLSIGGFEEAGRSVQRDNKDADI